MIKDTFKFFKERLLTHFLGMLISFTVALAAGYIMAVNTDAEIKMKIFEAVRGVIEGAGAIDGDGNISALGIFINNLRACANITVMGLVPFLFIPYVSVMMNGMLVGAVLGIVSGSFSQTVIYFVTLILPHGIFEIPAVALSGAMGTSLCILISAKIFGRKREERILTRAVMTARTFFVMVLPLVAVAAVIEGIVLPAILG